MVLLRACFRARLGCFTRAHLNIAMMGTVVQESFCGKPAAGSDVEYEKCSAQACEGKGFWT